MPRQPESFDYFSRRSLEEMIAAINAACGRAADAHLGLSALHVRRAAAAIACPWRATVVRLSRSPGRRRDQQFG